MVEWYRKYMYIIGIFGQSVFYSQFYEIIQNKSAKDVSLFGFICGLISVSSWLIYGIIIHDRPLIVSNIIAVIGASLTVSAIMFYQFT